MKKLNNFIKSRAFIITLTLTFIALIIAGVTYAWYTWTSTDNTNITMQIGESTIVTFTGGNAININNLTPVYNYANEPSTTFSLTNSNNNPLKEFYYNVYFDITSIANELISSSLKFVLLDGSSNVVDQGNFSAASSGSALTITENQPLPSGTSSYTLIIYLDANEQSNTNMMNKSLSGLLRVTAASRENTSITISSYLNYLYISAQKSTATVNNITYNLAPSVNLMNDRHASMFIDINGGDIRYYGANPNNYVWLGDTYIEDVTFPADTNGTDIVRHTGDKKLWRIIGVFDGKVKLVSNDPISDTKLSWDTSANVTGGNSGRGINQWGESVYSDTGNPYEGADLMRLLNQGYENEPVNNSLYWNKGTGTVYTGRSNATTANVSFANTGLTDVEKNMIDTVTWNLGAGNASDVSVNTRYGAERQGSTLGKICSSGTDCNDVVTRTSTWTGKVGLIYPSDYGFAADLAQCNQTLSHYKETGCFDTDWLFPNNTSWTLSPTSHSAMADQVFTTSKRVSYLGVTCGNNIVHSAIYLKPEVTIDTDGKDGSEEYPYVLSLS